MLRIRGSLDVIIDKLEGLLREIAGPIRAWSATPCVGVTHLQPAEPTTVGYRLEVYGYDLLSDLDELRRIRASLRGTGITGGVGTSASFAELLGAASSKMSPRPREAQTMAILELEPYPITGQTYPRKQDWLVMNALAGLAALKSRLALRDIPGANPRFAVVHDEASLLAGLDQVGLPAVLKPAGASSGRGILPIDVADYARDAYHAFRSYCAPTRDPVYSYHADECVLEQKLVGSEHSLSGLVVAGEVYLMAITDKSVDRTIGLNYQTALPTRLSPEIQSTAAEIAKLAIPCLGIDHCGFHMDFMVTKDGPRVLEIGGRLGGECVNSHLIPTAVPGLNPYDALLRVVQGKDPESYLERASSRAALRAILPPQPGRITAIRGLDAVRTHVHVRELLQVRDVGAEVVYPRDKYNAFPIAYILVECPLDREIDQVIAEIIDLVTIEVAPLDQP
ncbi:MAG: ATP-grasp domain-containing protein [Myxococcota bacterium]